MPCQLRIFVLGALRLERPDGTPIAFPGAKAGAALACLSAAPAQRMARSQLVDLLWSDLPSTSAARHALRQCLLRLRAALGPAADGIGADADDLWLEQDLVEIDLVALRHALGTEGGDEVRQLSDAVGQGFCCGLEIGGDAFEDWLRQQRLEADRLCAVLHERAAEAFAARGQMDQAIGAAQRRVAVGIYDEAAHAALISLNMRAGRRHAAVAARDACITLFRRDLDLVPQAHLDQAMQTPIAAPISRHAQASDPALPFLPVPRRARPKASLSVALAALAALLLIDAPAQAPAPVASDRADPSAMVAWISAAAAKSPAVAAGGLSTVLSDEARRDGIRTMLEGDVKHAMLYPVGC